MCRSAIAAALLFFISNSAWSQQPSFTIEAQYAPNEINNSDFFSINFAAPVTRSSRIGHLYAQLSYSGFSESYGAQNDRLRNIFFGIGAEYHARVSPYIEAGVSADTAFLFIADILLSDNYDCIETDNCLSDGGDTYIILGARLFITRQLNLGAFIETISFANDHSYNDTRHTVTGMNLRFFF